MCQYPLLANWKYRFAISANTTCPTTQQCMAIYRLSDEDFDAISSSEKGCAFLQCPGRVQLAIFELSKLRLPVFRKVNSDRDMCDKIQSIAERLDNVNLEAWATEYCAEADRAVTAANVARIVVAAVRLYGILALPKTCAGLWMASSPTMQHTVSSGVQGHLEAYNRARVWHRERLLQLLRAAEEYLFEERMLPGGVVWALFIAGVAVSDGSEESREFIKSTLTRCSQGPVASPCFRACAERLDAVWRQGLTDWEDCVSEPLVLYA
ncbi:hypothetical protein NLG97_g3534 [Lecanicillium saksenae]|uniref:Uncharacterized protein n=1 Tax=Lecanicillium saksenae TaxID=468837 RepID=A0ACC1QZM2_9HYPO|nr:hypothetical protein NLG97_g3534 [Lecanicillium saksenae]